MSENEFFHEIKRDGITSLHGIHVKMFRGPYHLFQVRVIAPQEMLVQSIGQLLQVNSGKGLDVTHIPSIDTGSV